MRAGARDLEAEQRELALELRRAARAARPRPRRPSRARRSPARAPTCASPRSRAPASSGSSASSTRSICCASDQSCGMEQHHLLLDADRVRARPRGADVHCAQSCCGSLMPPAARCAARAHAAAARTRPANSARLLGAARSGTRRATARRRTNGRPGASIALDHAVRRARRHPQAVAEVVDRLVVEGVHLAASASPISRAERGPRSISHRVRGADRPGSLLAVRRYAPSGAPAGAGTSVPPRATFSACVPRQIASSGMPSCQARRAAASSKRSMIGLRRPKLPDAAARRRRPAPGPDRRTGTRRPADRAAARRASASSAGSTTGMPPAASIARTYSTPSASSTCARLALRRACLTASLRRISEVVTPISGRPPATVSREHPRVLAAAVLARVDDQRAGVDARPA